MTKWKQMEENIGKKLGRGRKNVKKMGKENEKGKWEWKMGKENGKGKWERKMGNENEESEGWGSRKMN